MDGNRCVKLECVCMLVCDSGQDALADLQLIACFDCYASRTLSVSIMRFAMVLSSLLEYP